MSASPARRAARVFLHACVSLRTVAVALVGVLIPLGLKWAGSDPAIASAVVLTAVTDICGFGFFLGLLTLFHRFLG